jgi:PAS domain-containing protein
MPTRNPRYTPPLVGELACKAAYPASMIDAIPNQDLWHKSETSATCTVLVGKDNSYVEVSDGFCRLVGYNREELLRMKLEELAAPGTADTMKAFRHAEVTGCACGLWLLVSREKTRILVRYDLGIRNDSLLQIHLELIGAGY